MNDRNIRDDELLTATRQTEACASIIGNNCAYGPDHSHTEIDTEQTDSNFKMILDDRILQEKVS